MRRIKIRVLHRIIEMADSAELDEITKAVLSRYGKLFEDEEVVFLSMPKNDKEERLRIISAILSMEKNYG